MIREISSIRNDDSNMLSVSERRTLFMPDSVTETNEFTPNKYIKMDFTHYDPETETITQYLFSTIASLVLMEYQSPEDGSKETKSVESVLKDLIDKVYHLQMESEVDVITEEELMEIIKKAEAQVDYELTGNTPSE